MELKRDPVEDTEEYKAVAEEVESMAETLVDPNIRYGRYFFVEEEKKKLFQAGIVANNIKDFFSIILNCGYVSDWAKFDWLSDENTFIKAYGELELSRDNVCVNLFVEENELESEPVKVYNIFKKAVCTQPQLTIRAISDDYVDYEQLFNV